MRLSRLLVSSAIAASFIARAALAQSGKMFDPADFRQIVQTLGSDAFEGRAPNTRAETKTVAYIVDKFQKAGLQPGGPLVNGTRSWTQPVPLLKSEWVAPPSATLTLDGKPLALTQGQEIAIRAPTNGDSAIDLSKAPLVFAGYGVKAPERGWDDFKGHDMRGKIMVVLVNDPDFEGGEGSFGGKAMTYYGRWTYKYEEGARQGAAGVLVIHETEPASYGWNTVKNSNTNAMFDIVRQNPSAEHPELEGWIQRDLAEKIFAASGKSFEAMKAAAKKKDFQPVPLDATLSIDGKANAQVITSQNVVGILPGKSRPDETVIYTAHWDHLGIGQPDATGDRIYNGALDNATGISQIIEQARAFAREPRTDRSVVFLAVTAEEKGLLGSEYYAANPIYPLSKTVAVLNTDSMGVWGPAKNFSISGTAKLGLIDELVAQAKTQGRTFLPDPHPESGGFYRSDHFPFAKVGVPAVSFESGNDLVNGGVARSEQIGHDYVEKSYHQPSDEYSPTWDFTGIAQDARLLHLVGMHLANTDVWPNWSQDSEFRALRDETAAQRGATVAPAPMPAASRPAQQPVPGERG
jgi:Zn-dependent M28 family amino/carboxypeptidase